MAVKAYSLPSCFGRVANTRVLNLVISPAGAMAAKEKASPRKAESKSGNLRTQIRLSCEIVPLFERDDEKAGQKL